nr:MAG TPA: hypothetical protein [Caudoviricetes sp.]
MPGQQSKPGMFPIVAVKFRKVTGNRNSKKPENTGFIIICCQCCHSL